MIRQYVCILDNCESFVSWASSREEAVSECTAKAGKPVHVWATGRKFRDTERGRESAMLFGDRQESEAACLHKPNAGGERTACPKGTNEQE